MEVTRSVPRPADPDRHRPRGVGLAFKTSIAPFHKWTPDVYQGAPTPITSFMAVATKAAALRGLPPLLRRRPRPGDGDWQMGLAILAAISIVVGNVGALGQNSLKRLLGYSGIAQAGYMLGGLVVASEKGVSCAGLLPRIYLLMNLAGLRRYRRPRARDAPTATTSAAFAGSGGSARRSAWPLTISMLGAGRLPATAGFMASSPDRGPGRRQLPSGWRSSSSAGR